MAFVSLKTIYRGCCRPNDGESFLLPVIPREKDVEDKRYARPASCLASYSSLPAFTMARERLSLVGSIVHTRVNIISNGRRDLLSCLHAEVCNVCLMKTHTII